ncbi:MAG: dTDP-4-dehydrorhamnose reductase [Anaerolineae bacterium]|nr:dTDP-4-dehydrorhamnose reductase [Anaerolineae bacterium]
MRVAVIGSRGQLGSTLMGLLPAEETLGMDLPEHDVTDLESSVDILKAFEPDVILHTAAMTDVDGCERDPEQAYRINVLGTRNVAVGAQACDAALVYISTDYVFDGARDEPYWEYDGANPLSVYGRTKWVGETVVRDLLSRFFIVRTAWLYGPGPRNFVRTVLRLASQRDELSMVTDEVGSPTYAADLAQGLLQLVAQPAYGVYHLSNAGACSRYEWAQEILRLAGRSDVRLLPTTNYPRAARVPKHCELRNFFGAELGITMRPWRLALVDYFAAEKLG